MGSPVRVYDTIRNISRHVTETSTGWYVRMQSIGRHKRKYFSDEKYGGKTKSLQAAKEFRDLIRKKAKDGRIKP